MQNFVASLFAECVKKVGFVTSKVVFIFATHTYAYVGFSTQPMALAPPGAPTYWLADYINLPYITDFFAFKGIHMRNLQSSCIVDLGSDHVPVEPNDSNLPASLPTHTLLINKTPD